MSSWESMFAALRASMVEASVAGLRTAEEGALEAVAPYEALLPEGRMDAVVRRLVADAAGTGPLEELLADSSVDEVMVNGANEVWVERSGLLELTGVRFESAEALRDAIERMLATAGRRVDDLAPLADARLPDGSRINVALPPLAVNGPFVTIRRFRTGGFTLERLAEEGTIDDGLAELLAEVVVDGKNILVCGATGSGKTCTLGALAGAIPAAERVVTIEDAAELVVDHPHVVRLEARPPSPSGNGGVTIRDLVRNALRMRPNRIVVGEVRGAEAADMLDAMSTGHSGSLSTVHAGSAEGALNRLQHLALTAALGLPAEAMAERVSAAIDLVVHQVRLADGRRVIESVTAVGGEGRGHLEHVYRRGSGWADCARGAS